MVQANRIIHIGPTIIFFMVVCGVGESYQRFSFGFFFVFSFVFGVIFLNMELFSFIVTFLSFFHSDSSFNYYLKV